MSGTHGLNEAYFGVTTEHIHTFFTTQSAQNVISHVYVWTQRAGTQ